MVSSMVGLRRARHHGDSYDAFAARAPSPWGAWGCGDDALRSAELIVQAAAPWSAATHHLFPAAARAHAVAVLRLAFLWRREHGDGIKDALLSVLPLSVERAPRWS